MKKVKTSYVTVVDKQFGTTSYIGQVTVLCELSRMNKAKALKDAKVLEASIQGVRRCATTNLLE